MKNFLALSMSSSLEGIEPV